MINSFDPRDRPPENIKRVYKRYQKLTPEAIQADPTILDFYRGSDGQLCKVRKVGSVPSSSIDAACSNVRMTEAHKDVASNVDVTVFETEAVPGKPGD